MTERRCVVLGDVVDSRTLDDRETARDRLERAVDAATDAAHDAVVAPFAVLKGVDEVGGVLEDPAGAVPAVRALVEELHPVELRVGVAYDVVDVAPDADAVAEMDGPAFHRADGCLREAADGDRYVRVALDPVPDVFERVLGDQLDLLSAWTYSWTPRQTEVVRAYRGAETMTAVAETLDVSVQTVSKTIGRTRARTVFDVEATLVDAFGTVGGASEWP